MNTDKPPVNPYILAGVSQVSRSVLVTRERRAHRRHLVDAKANIVLVKGGSVLRGTILNLSLTGCRILCDEKFKLGIHTRVEAEFRLGGLPFLLAGVIQTVHSTRDVGIRFLDVSSRKRQQIQQLIDEIEEIGSMSRACAGVSAEPRI